MLWEAVLMEFRVSKQPVIQTAELLGLLKVPSVGCHCMDLGRKPTAT